MHRIQIVNGTITKGIEVHDTKDAAVLSFWGRMKTGFGNPQNPGQTFISCKITDKSGNVIRPYEMSWGNTDLFFLHHIRRDRETFNKDIDACETFDEARRTYADQMEYGYNNPNHSDVTFVSCEITDRSGSAIDPFCETWEKSSEPAEEE